MARVLIVEDEPTDRVILANFLERMGHEVYLASDGEEAFKAYLKNSIEIIITDLNMPHVDGLKFIAAVRALFPGAVIIAVSGGGQMLLDEAEHMGAFVALSKPIDPQVLRQAIAEAAPDSLGRRKEDLGAPNNEPLILIVEDDPDQAALIQAALKTGLAQSKTHLVFYGWEAQGYPSDLSAQLMREHRGRQHEPCQESTHLRAESHQAGHTRSTHGHGHGQDHHHFVAALVRCLADHSRQDIAPKRDHCSHCQGAGEKAQQQHSPGLLFGDVRPLSGPLGQNG